ncbi:MAG: hypothetical protein H7240_03525 [Glaciimonas sp.]|nr:hypothetical protein [Glaciimonas sp.]
MMKIVGSWPALLIVLLILEMAYLLPTVAADPKEMLGTIHHHKILTSAVPENGDVNLYAIVVAPVTIA